MYKNGVALPLSTQSTEQFHSTKEAAQQKGGGGASGKNPIGAESGSINIFVISF